MRTRGMKHGVFPCSLLSCWASPSVVGAFKVSSVLRMRIGVRAKIEPWLCARVAPREVQRPHAFPLRNSAHLPLRVVSVSGCLGRLLGVQPWDPLDLRIAVWGAAAQVVHVRLCTRALTVSRRSNTHCIVACDHVVLTHSPASSEKPRVFTPTSSANIADDTFSFACGGDTVPA